MPAVHGVVVAAAVRDGDLLLLVIVGDLYDVRMLDQWSCIDKATLETDLPSCKDSARATVTARPKV